MKEILMKTLIGPYVLILYCASVSCTKTLYVKHTETIEGGVQLACEKRSFSVDDSVIIAADSQFHNIYGSGLISNSVLSYAATRVALRPIAMNLWSETLLDTYISNMMHKLTPAQDSSNGPLLFFLGDAADIGCTNEYDQLTKVMKAYEWRREEGFTPSPSDNPNGLTWLMVHGNHDSYMMGNFNSYKRHDKFLLPRSWEHPESEYTGDESHFFAFIQDPKCTKLLTAERSWAGSCADPKRSSVPMYKGVWLRRYLESLSGQIHYSVHTTKDWHRNVVPTTSSLLGDAVCEPPRYVEGRAYSDTPLAKRNFFLSGKIYSRRRLPHEEPCTHTVDSTVNTYRSFVVQSVDINNSVRAILIDSSHIDEWLSPKSVLTVAGSAGSRGNITAEQMAEIQTHAEVARQRRQRVAIFAHNPLVDLPPKQQEALLLLQPIAYVSGHTHFESSVIVHGRTNSKLLELNVGSTTDWPMEAMIVSLNPSVIRWGVFGARQSTDVQGDEKNSICSYERISGLPDKATCNAYSRNDYLSYINRGSLTISHGLCTLQGELKRISTGWRLPLTQEQNATIASTFSKDLQDWSKPAEELKLIVDKLRSDAQGLGIIRDLSLCQAVEASRAAKSNYRGGFDKDPERSRKTSRQVLPATAYSVAYRSPDWVVFSEDVP